MFTHKHMHRHMCTHPTTHKIKQDVLYRIITIIVMHFKIGRFRLPTICLKSPEMLCEGFRFAEILGSKFKSEVICGLRSTSS